VGSNLDSVVSAIQSASDILRGDHKPSSYGKIILPLVVVKRFSYGSWKHLLGVESDKLAESMTQIITSLPVPVQEAVSLFEFEKEIPNLIKTNTLPLLLERFDSLDLSPESLPTEDMGSVFEELIRKFGESESHGEHYTPKDVVGLLLNLLFIGPEPDDVYDPTCGTGGMLATVQEMFPSSTVYGQEINKESYALCMADMVLRGNDPSTIRLGDTLANDLFPAQTFSYMISNPPYGVDWKKIKKLITEEHKKEDGRFCVGLPRVNDGSFLFVQHLISKMKSQEEGGSRIAIVLNGSPLFTGAAGSGESEIRKWLFEKDYVEAIIGLPDQLFYNTGISTYIWILTNNKPDQRKGKTQLINAVDFYEKMRKGLGNKRKEITETHTNNIVALYHAFEETKQSKIMNNEDFGYYRVCVERPQRLSSYTLTEEILESLEKEHGILKGLSDITDKSFPIKDTFEKALRKNAEFEMSEEVLRPILDRCVVDNPDGDISLDKKGNPVVDVSLRDHENIPLTSNIQDYMEKEVLPHVPDAWIDESKTKVGYEIPFTRYFYEYIPPRPLHEIEAEILGLEQDIASLLGYYLVPKDSVLLKRSKKNDDHYESEGNVGEVKE